MIRQIAQLFQYRELLRNLVIRDLKVRYRNSVLGVLWSLLNPLLMTLIFTFVFTFMLPNNIENYPVFFMAGFLPWSLFAASVSGATESIVANASLIKKVYFPREILPLSQVLANLVHFLLALVVLFGLLFVFQMGLTPAVLMLPLIIFTELMLVAGVGLLLATANVFYRDTQHILQILLQALFFLTPIFYPIDLLPESTVILGVTVNLQLWLRRVNPLASLVASYQDVLYFGQFTGLDFFLRTFVTCLVILIVGYLVFIRYSRLFGEEA
jgi:lipopolysaccharide transport system permease protein